MRAIGGPTNPYGTNYSAYQPVNTQEEQTEAAVQVDENKSDGKEEADSRRNIELHYGFELTSAGENRTAEEYSRAAQSGVETGHYREAGLLVNVIDDKEKSQEAFSACVDSVFNQFDPSSAAAYDAIHELLGLPIYPDILDSKEWDSRRENP